MTASRVVNVPSSHSDRRIEVSAMPDGHASGGPSSDPSDIRLGPVYEVIGDAERAKGNAAPLDRAIEKVRRMYDQFCGRYPVGRGAELVIDVIARKPRQ